VLAGTAESDGYNTLSVHGSLGACFSANSGTSALVLRIALSDGAQAGWGDYVRWSYPGICDAELHDGLATVADASR